MHAIILIDMDYQDESLDELNSLYSEAPFYSTAKSWYNEYNYDRCLILDEFRASHPKSVVVPENIDAVRELIKQDRRWHTVRLRYLWTLIWQASIKYHMNMVVKKVYSPLSRIIWQTLKKGSRRSMQGNADKIR